MTTRIKLASPLLALHSERLLIEVSGNNSQFFRSLFRVLCLIVTFKVKIHFNEQTNICFYVFAKKRILTRVRVKNTREKHPLSQER